MVEMLQNLLLNKKKAPKKKKAKKMKFNKDEFFQGNI
jgi:hypothetical protein